MWGKGRAIAASHGGFWGDAALKNADNRRLFANLIQYLGRNKPGLRILLLSADDGAGKAAIAGVVPTVTTIEMVAPDRVTPAILKNADVVITGQDAFANMPDADARMDTVRDWIKGGGGLLIAGPVWGWKQINPDKDVTIDHTGNRLLRPLGLAFSDGTVGGRGPKSGWSVPSEEDAMLHGKAALDTLTAQSTVSPSTPLDPKSAAGMELAQASATVTDLVGVLPETDPFARRVAALCKNAPVAIPTKEAPITNAQPLVRLKMTLEAKADAKQPVEKIAANPASVSFPGPVPNNAPRLAEQKCVVDCAVPDWHSTGLYAAPGEVVIVTLPPNAENKNLAVRIGAHRDVLWNLPKWERYPEITTEQKIKGRELRIASSFGGPVYVVVPRGSKLGKITVTVSGAVLAPHFVRGKTTPEQWIALRSAPAPWAELEGEQCILTVPSDVVRDLVNPEVLMAYWDSVMNAAADLYSIPRDRARPERYCTDRQISAGYMHSGYPIMTGLDVAPVFTDVNALNGKSGIKVWGFYHELGHNHQQGDWTWDGTGEVTNNLFSLYGTEMLNGAAPPAHPALEKVAARKKLETYLAGGAKYDQWKSDPFLALGLFSQLRDAFGWEPFKQVFAEYRTLQPGEHPKTDEEKRDLFMTRFSRTIGKNLGPFFTAWGVPTSDAARAKLTGLPLWMPAPDVLPVATR